MKKLIPCPKSTSPAILRLLTGTMPMSGRIDMLKLRYFWKLQHAKENNAVHQVYLKLRRNFLKGKEGYMHEVFNICCKYGRMDLWHGKCPAKENPMSRIRNIVELYHLKRDQEATRKNSCIYAGMVNLKEKRYNFEERLKTIGRFQTTEHRRVLMYTMLDNERFEKECGNCGKTVEDITKHGMEECTAVEHHRKVYKLRMNYIIPQRI